MKQLISIIVKIISDKNIKKMIIKYFLFSIAKRLLELIDLYTDEEISLIFDFLKEIHDSHNDPLKQVYFASFWDTFEGRIYLEDNYNMTKLGLRLSILPNSNTNINLVRNILNIFYNKINSSLSKLEEIFSEFNFKQNTNNNISISNIANDSVNNNLGLVNTYNNDSESKDDSF